MRIDQALAEATKRLKSHSIEGARRDASVLMVAVLGGDREILFRAPEQILTTRQLDLFQQYIARRSTREPVSHIVGTREFWSRDFYVNADVLDPRPDSETLIDAVLKQKSVKKAPLSILDLGTGSGCLLLTLLAELEGATGTGVDFSQRALDVARKNAVSLALQNRAQFIQSNWFEAVSGVFDVIVSNPPYIESDEIDTLQAEVRDFEPHLALDGGVDGLECYRLIISEIGGYLKSEGYAIFEVGIGQEKALVDLLKIAGFVNVDVHFDVASIARCVSGRLKK